MTKEEYEAMVGRLEEVARRDPDKYRLRVGLLAALGYGYIILVVGLLVAAGVGLIVVSWRAGRALTTVLKFIWFAPLALAWFVLKALWVRVPPPEGFELGRADAPELFAAIDEITATLAAPKITRVLIDGGYNAGVVQLPRLGPLGWFRNYLILGLPLMQALSPAHFRAVLGHELGHLSGNHGRFTGWIYRVRDTWVMLLQRFHVEQQWGAFIFNWFFDWYAPYFHAYSFVLARAHEYEADAAAGRMGGPGVMADALIAYRTMGAHLAEGYWPAVFREADTEPRPVRGAFARLSNVLREPVPAESAAGYLLAALAEETAHDDTHPALAARLAALGHPAGAADGEARKRWAEGFKLAPPAETAAGRYLGASERGLAEKLDEEWQRSVSDEWRARHQYVRESREKIARLEERARTAELTPDQSFELGKLKSEFGEAEDAIRHLDAVPQLNPHYAEASFILGHLLLIKGDEAGGVRRFEEAMARDPEATVGACLNLYIYFNERGRADEAEKYRARAERHAAAVQNGQQ